MTFVSPFSYHWDLPQYLQDLGGWTNPIIVKYFEIYSELLFKSYGDRVKEWITFNEPATFCDLGYSWASHAPHIWTDRKIGGYLCSHHILLAHASAYQIYKEKYFDSQQGKVGICLNAGFKFPANDSVTQETVDKAIDFDVSAYELKIVGTCYSINFYTLSSVVTLIRFSPVKATILKSCGMPLMQRA
jgi:beta-glucosidase/6-phospho-beta-glucosidase/beta-galactosidase